MLTEQEIIDTGFTKDEDLSTDSMLRYTFSVNRPDLNPLYTTNEYVLIYDVDNDIYDLAGNLKHNRMKVMYTTTYQGPIASQTELQRWMTQFLRKDLRWSSLIRKNNT